MTEQEFLQDAESDQHRTLLWLALRATSISSLPVLELGAGHGSTKYLRQYCNEVGRKFISWDSDKEWGEKWGCDDIIADWSNPEIYKKYSVVLVDQGPGGSRRDSMRILKEDALILVAHDAEPENENSYKLYTIWPLFKYKIVTKGEKIWTVAASNHINLHEYKNKIINNQKIELL